MRIGFWVACALLLAGGALALGQAPTYEQDEVITLNSKQEREFWRDVQQILRGQEPLAPKAALFNGWYARYRLPQMSRLENLEQLPELRRDLLLMSLSRAVGPAREQLLSLTRTYFNKVVRGNYHPLARHNAALILGYLDSTPEGRENSRTIPPVPDAQSRESLIELLADAEQPDAVKVAALSGLSRHVYIDGMHKAAELRMSAEDRGKVYNALLAVASASDPPAGRSPEGHAWMRRRAMEALGYLGLVDPEGRLLDTLNGILSSQDAPLSLRVAAVRALGELKLPADSKVDPTKLGAKVSFVAVLSCFAELKRLKAWEEEQEERGNPQGGPLAPGGEGGVLPGGEGGVPPRDVPPRRPPRAEQPNFPGEIPGGGEGLFPGESGLEGVAVEKTPLDQQLDLTVRRLKYNFDAVRQGLEGAEAGGVLAIAQEPKSRQKLTEFLTQTQALAALLDSEELDLDALREGLSKEGSKLQEAVMPVLKSN